MKTFSYLALGDSYTIGEQVPIAQSFPYQTVQLLRKSGISVYAPEIIATTGWTTDELENGINQSQCLPGYDFVSLLIGVNNQYRGRTVDNFMPDFEQLLIRALKFGGNQPAHVAVLSIPDWGITPFAAGKDRAKIATEIDAYNAACEKIASQHGCFYIDITGAQRIDGNNKEFLAGDELHPSGKEYAKWADQLAKRMLAILR